MLLKYRFYLLLQTHGATLLMSCLRQAVIIWVNVRQEWKLTL